MLCVALSSNHACVWWHVQIHSGFTDSVNDVVAPDLKKQKGPFMGPSDGDKRVAVEGEMLKECPGGLKEAVAAILPPGKKITKYVHM
jgi:hypothetical protein